MVSKQINIKKELADKLIDELMINDFGIKTKSYSEGIQELFIIKEEYEQRKNSMGIHNVRRKNK